jgi:hypothetical protein
MGALLGTIIKVLLQVLAGVGVGKVIDKVAADKVPNYEPMEPGLAPWESGFKPMKLIFLVISFVLGGIVLGFIAKKFKIRILK